MKTCRKCGRQLSLEDFYKHSMMTDGHFNFCKSCVKARVAEHRQEHIEQIREYDRHRALSPERKALMVANIARWEANHLGAEKAHNAVNNAVRDGRLDKPAVCSICACQPSRLMGHHADYRDPLDVLWVCQPCHKKIHAAGVAA